jgi:hypothetical protein
MPCYCLPAVRGLPNENMLEQTLLNLAIALPFDLLPLLVLLELLFLDPTSLA